MVHTEKQYDIQTIIMKPF